MAKHYVLSPAVCLDDAAAWRRYIALAYRRGWIPEASLMLASHARCLEMARRVRVGTLSVGVYSADPLTPLEG